MSHQWKTQRMGGNPADAESYEKVRYHTACGVGYSEDDDLPPCMEEMILEPDGGTE